MAEVFRFLDTAAAGALKKVISHVTSQKDSYIKPCWKDGQRRRKNVLPPDLLTFFTATIQGVLNKDLTLLEICFAVVTGRSQLFSVQACEVNGCNTVG